MIADFYIDRELLSVDFNSTKNKKKHGFIEFIIKKNKIS